MNSWKTLAAAWIAVCLLSAHAFPAPADSTVIGVSLLTRKPEFFKYLENGMRREAQARGCVLLVEAAEFDIALQQEQVKDFIAKKVSAIVLTPCDSREIGSSIEEANRAGIPVFTVDIASISLKGKVVAHIASDNLDGGRKAAQLMVKAIGDSGSVVIINHPNITSVMDRVAGFREVLRDHPRVQILAEIPAWGMRDRATSIMEDILLKIPEVSGVFAINDNAALGALDAVKAAGKKVSIVGYDGIPEARKAIDQGKIFGTVIQYPEKIGTITIETIVRFRGGETVPYLVKVPVGVLTRDHR